MKTVNDQMKCLTSSCAVIGQQESWGKTPWAATVAAVPRMTHGQLKEWLSLLILLEWYDALHSAQGFTHLMSVIRSESLITITVNGINIPVLLVYTV